MTLLETDCGIHPAPLAWSSFLWRSLYQICDFRSDICTVSGAMHMDLEHPYSKRPRIQDIQVPCNPVGFAVEVIELRATARSAAKKRKAGGAGSPDPAISTIYIIYSMPAIFRANPSILFRSPIIDLRLDHRPSAYDLSLGCMYDAYL